MTPNDQDQQNPPGPPYENDGETQGNGNEPTTEFQGSEAEYFSEPEKTSWTNRLREKIAGLRRSKSEETVVQHLTAAEEAPFQDEPTRAVRSFQLPKFSKVDPMAVGAWASSAFQSQGNAFFGKLATVLLSAYFLSNVTGLLLENYIPEPPVARPVSSSTTVARAPTVDDYQLIFNRNLFNSKGLIPGEQTATEESPDLGGQPVRSSLPLNLIGTLILKNELRSIATIEDKSKQTVYPVRMEEEIPGVLKVVSVETNRVVFVNTSTGRREFIDIPEDPSSNNARITIGTPRKNATPGAGIEQTAPNQFNLPRAEVDKALSDINQVLTQARAVPNMENGVPAGYKLFQIVPGSIYDKLGLKNGDTLCGLNGEAINDPGRAFALLNELKTSSHLELCVKRDGRQSNFAYDIR